MLKLTITTGKKKETALIKIIVRKLKLIIITKTNKHM